MIHLFVCINVNVRHIHVRKLTVDSKCGQVGPAEHNIESLTKHPQMTKSLTAVVVDELCLITVPSRYNDTCKLMPASPP